MKVCNRCHENKPHAAFEKGKTSRGGRRGICKACRATADRARRAADPQFRDRLRRYSQLRYWIKRADPQRNERLARWAAAGLSLCRGCNEPRPFDHFFTVPGNKRKNVGSRCRACRKAAARTYNDTQAARKKRSARERQSRQTMSDAQRTRRAGFTRRCREEMRDHYVKERLTRQGVPSAAVTPALIGAKRAHLKLVRLICQPKAKEIHR